MLSVSSKINEDIDPPTPHWAVSFPTRLPERRSSKSSSNNERPPSEALLSDVTLGLWVTIERVGALKLSSHSDKMRGSGVGSAGLILPDDWSEHAPPTL